MNEHPRGPIPSRAQIAGHPIHPMLVPFPIAFLVGAFFSDILLLLTEDPFWARASFYLLLAGLVTGLLAATFGLIDFASRLRIRRLRAAWIHLLGNALVLVLTLVNVLIRDDDPMAAVIPEGLLLSTVTSGILILTGWMGGEMVYRHRVGVEE